MKKRSLIFYLFLSSLINTAAAQSDGLYDPNFAYVFDASLSNAKGLALQSNGKIVWGGGQLNVDGLYSDGSLNFTSYQSLASGELLSIATQADDKIVAVGMIQMGLEDSRIEILRLNPYGSYDNTFNSNGRLSLDPTPGFDYARSVAIQDDNKIVVACEFSAGENNSETVIIRLNSDGSMDATFAANGMFRIDVSSMWEMPNDICIQDDGKIVVAGQCTNPSVGRSGYIIRLNENGSLDSTLSGTGVFHTQFGAGCDVYDLAIQADGKYLLAGAYAVGYTHHYGLFRINPDGTTDLSFGTGGKFTYFLGTYDYGRAVEVQDDGKILFAGYHSSGYPNSSGVIFRLLNNGTLDPTFSDDGILITDLGYIYALKLQSDGKILVAGGDQGYGYGRVERFYGHKPDVTLNFDGTDDYVSIADNDATINAMTIEAWVYWTPDANTDIQFICSKSMEQMELHTAGGSGSNGIRFIPASGVYLDAYNVLPMNRWTHIAAVYDPSQALAKMYINGLETPLTNNGTNPLTTPVSNTTSDFTLGKRTGVGFNFKGSIDEVRIWNTAKTQAEIEADFTNTLNDYGQPELVAFYTFDQGMPGDTNTTDTLLYDTRLLFNGTLDNFALNSNTSNWIESYAMVIPQALPPDSISLTSFRARWNHPETGIVENYVLEVSHVSDFSTQIAGSPFTISYPTNSLHIPLIVDTVYFYRVRANKSSVNNQGAYSRVITVVTDAFNINASADSLGVVSGSGTYVYNSIAVINATPDFGYHLEFWIEDSAVVSTDNPYVFPVTEDRDLLAYFSINTYVIDSLINIAGSGSITGNGTYLHGDTVTMTASPVFGYHFLNWTSNDSVIETNDTLIFVILSDTTIVANFELNSYVITAATNLVNSGTITGGGTYFHGDSVTLIATPNEYYAFLNWTENGNVISTNETLELIAFSDSTLVANFELRDYAIHATANPVNYGIAAGSGAYNDGDTVTVIATPAWGYHFVNWTENGNEIDTNETFVFIAISDTNLTANFAINSYSINAVDNPSNAGSISGTGTYNHGDTVTLSATPDWGYHFANWSENGNILSVNETFVFIATSDTALVANFELDTYTVTNTVNPVNSGYINGNGLYSHGYTVTLLATPLEYYAFVSWTDGGNVVSTNETFEFTIYSDTGFVANFELRDYSIHATANPANSGTIAGVGAYNDGDTVTLVAIPNTGYHFTNWTENGNIIDTNETIVFIATSDTSLVANFEINTYLVTAVENPASSGTTTGSGTYNHGDTVTLVATANFGHHFINWTENGNIIGVNDTFEFVVVSDTSLVANFEINTYMVTAVENPANSGTTTGSGTYNHGDTVTLVATANSGYHFINWSENGNVIGTNETLSFIVVSDTLLVANFEINTYMVTAVENPASSGTTTGSGTYNHGDTVTLVATANSGYHFVNWSENGNAIDTNETFSFVVVSDTLLVANFEINTYMVTAVENPANSGTITGSGTYNHGDTVTLVATANSGYHFINWSENGNIIDTNETLSFIISSDTMLVANFVYSSGIQNNYTDLIVVLRPTVVDNQLIIEIKSNWRKVDIEILNSSGQIVFRGSMIEEIIIQTESFAPGVYLVKLSNGYFCKMQKIIKM